MQHFFKSKPKKIKVESTQLSNTITKKVAFLSETQKSTLLKPTKTHRNNAVSQSKARNQHLLHSTKTQLKTNKKQHQLQQNQISRHHHLYITIIVKKKKANFLTKEEKKKNTYKREASCASC